MASLEELKKTRFDKLELLKKEGMNPYPISSEPDFSLSEVAEKFETLSVGGKETTLLGRVMSIRPQGGIIFITLFDGTGKFQGLLKKGETDEKLFDLFSNAVDIGDFVQITGTLFLTKRGEKTLQVKSWKMLGKSLLYSS